MLDDEGGFTVWGKLNLAEASQSLGGLPMGLAHSARLKADIPANRRIRKQDVEADESLEVVKIRRAMEEGFRGPRGAFASQCPSLSLNKTSGGAREMVFK